ncbi:acyl-CoA thioesterase [Flavobacterium soyangense]|uniref:Acyl-CoA thioesterase n=1 Tax=Flavobacterium soyangense TaxID=2023265 RepID=A0A930UAE1_9FLAO|nr:acyl-CoA thioesterase [Flavobacterium soyangense]MBF2709903.1 acyl-CoA thioesterase [Flavobacterium soyangense]
MNKNPNSKYKIRFTDCDMFGHLNNSRYLDYLINAREDHLKDFYNFDFNEYYKNDLAWVISSHEISYLKPALFNETVSIQSTLLRVDIEFLHLETIMMNQEQNQIKAIMRSKLIPINLKTGRKAPHDLPFMEWAKTIENTEVANHGNLQDRIKQLLTDFKVKKN